MSETNLERVTQDAANKSGEAWRDAANRVGTERVSLQKQAALAQNEAEILGERSQMKADEANQLRRESETLESAESAMSAKADVAASPPGISDRMRAGFQSMKEKFKSTVGNASKSIEETGDRASERYNEAAASVKQSAAETMANTATKSADAAERMKDSADYSYAKAQLAKDKADTTRLERERGTDENKLELEREREAERERQLDRERGGSTKDSIKEKASGTMERAAETVGDRARETEESMGERRRDAQLAQGKVPERT